VKRADEVVVGDRVREQGDVVEVVTVEHRAPDLVILGLGFAHNGYPYRADEQVEVVP
jgi:hypothetical protein